MISWEYDKVSDRKKQISHNRHPHTHTHTHRMIKFANYCTLIPVAISFVIYYKYNVHILALILNVINHLFWNFWRVTRHHYSCDSFNDIILKFTNIATQCVLFTFAFVVHFSARLLFAITWHCIFSFVFLFLLPFCVVRLVFSALTINHSKYWKYRQTNVLPHAYNASVLASD